MPSNTRRMRCRTQRVRLDYSYLDAICDGYTSSVTRRKATFATFSSRRRLKVEPQPRLAFHIYYAIPLYVILSGENRKAVFAVEVLPSEERGKTEER